MQQILKPGDYYGDTFRRRDVSQTLLTEVTYPLRHWTPTHIHQRAYFSFVIEGAHDLLMSDNYDKNRSSALIFHPAGTVHQEQMRTRGGRSFYVEVAPALLDDLENELKDQRQPIVLASSNNYRLAAKLYQEFRGFDSASRLAIEGLVLQMLAQCMRYQPGSKGSKIPEWLLRAREIVREEYCDSVSLSSIARLVGVHPIHLAAQFRKFYQCSIGDYVRRLRIEKACVQLSSCNESLAQIALSLGFSDQAHFTRTFKSYLGLTPSAYRKLKS